MFAHIVGSRVQRYISTRLKGGRLSQGCYKIIFKSGMLSVWIKARGNAPMPSSPIVEQLASEMARSLWNINTAAQHLFCETSSIKVRYNNRNERSWKKFVEHIMSAPTSGFLFHYKVITNGRVRTEDTCLVETGRQQRGCFIPQAVKNTQVLLKIGQLIARNMLRWLELLISRYCFI